VSRTGTGSAAPGTARINHMIHIAAVTQLRLNTEGRAYYRRKRAASKKPLEAWDASSGLSPWISDAIYRQLSADAQRAALLASVPDNAGPGGHCRASHQYSRPTPAHRHFGSATSRTRTPDATPHPGLREPPRSSGSPSPRVGAPEPSTWRAPPTNDGDGDKHRRTPRDCLANGVSGGSHQ
jgi:hypothetical protein